MEPDGGGSACEPLHSPDLRSAGGADVGGGGPDLRGESLSYRELDERANRLAHHLRRRGVEPEARIRIYLEVSILGVLKGGGAYVPLDPGYLAGRLERMVANAAVWSRRTENRGLLIGWVAADAARFAMPVHTQNSGRSTSWRACRTWTRLS